MFNLEKLGSILPGNTFLYTYKKMCSKGVMPSIVTNEKLLHFRGGGVLEAREEVQGVDPNRSTHSVVSWQIATLRVHLFMHAPCTLRLLAVSISGDFPRGKRVSSLDSEPT